MPHAHREEKMEVEGKRETMPAHRPRVRGAAPSAVQVSRGWLVPKLFGLIRVRIWEPREEHAAACLPLAVTDSTSIYPLCILFTHLANFHITVSTLFLNSFHHLALLYVIMHFHRAACFFPSPLDLERMGTVPLAYCEFCSFSFSAFRITWIGSGVE